MNTAKEIRSSGKPIFIGGTGRCGTSILKRVLLQHPSIVGCEQELRLIVDPGGVVDLFQTLTRNWTPQAADSALNRFEEIYKSLKTKPIGASFLYRLFDLFKVSPSRYMGVSIGQNIDKALLHKSYLKLFERLNVAVCAGRWVGSPPWRLSPAMYECSEKSIQDVSIAVNEMFMDWFSSLVLDGTDFLWIDDTPYNLLRVEELLQLFPNMHLIHIYRDPRDVAVSYVSKNWGGGSVHGAALRIKEILDKWDRVKASIPVKQYSEISLESLAANPKLVLSMLTDRLDLPFSDELLSIKLDKVNNGRWKKELSDSDANQLCALFTDNIRRLYGDPNN